MASLTIGGVVREIRLTAANIEAAEEQILKRGGRRVLEMFLKDSGMLSMTECRWLLWGAWRKTPGDDERVWAILTQFYEEGGTLPELHGELMAAMLDCGVIVRRPTTNGTGPPLDPPAAGTSG